MRLNLRENESEILDTWKKSQVFRLSRRAWLVSENAKGVDTKVLSRAVAMPEQRVVEVIDRYKQFGILGLIENPRSGRARKIPNGEVKYLLEDLTYDAEQEFAIKDIALKINQDSQEQISKDLIWRQARMDGIKLKRNVTKGIPIEEDEILNNIIGLVVTTSVTIIVVAKIKKILLLEGDLEVLNSDLRKNLLKKKCMSVLASMKVLANYGAVEIKERSKNEAMSRWAQRISKIARKDGVSIQIEVSGDYQSPELIDWLKTLKANELTEGRVESVKFALKVEDMSWAKKELIHAINKLKKSSTVYIWVKKLII